MKKIFTALAACMVVLSLSACSSGTSNTGGSYSNAGNSNSGTSSKSDTQTVSQPASEPPAEETKVTNKAYKVGDYEGTYTGDWHDGAPSGNGTFTSSEVTMSGEWFGGQLNGQGQKTWANGSVHSGNYVNGRLNGKGHQNFTREDGTKVTVDGTFNNGYMLSGKLINNCTDGEIDTYDGDWDSDNHFAAGTLTREYADGSAKAMQGKFAGSQLKSGALVVKNTDGSSNIYEGEWNSEGKFYNGNYVLYNSDGSVSESGTVTNGKWVDNTDAFLGGVAYGIGDAIRDEHPFWGLIFDEIGNAFVS